MSNIWLSTLTTSSPQEGYDLAVTLSRMAVKLTQPSAEAREEVRNDYMTSATHLIAVSHVVATNFQTVAAANNYWTEVEHSAEQALE